MCIKKEAVAEATSLSISLAYFLIFSGEPMDT